MTRLALIACLSLLAVPAYATFELADPANEALEKDMEDEWLNQGEAPCKHFAKDRQRNNEAYFAALKWIMAYVEATNPEIAARLYVSLNTVKASFEAIEPHINTILESSNDMFEVRGSTRPKRGSTGASLPKR